MPGRHVFILVLLTLLSFAAVIPLQAENPAESRLIVEVQALSPLSSYSMELMASDRRQMVVRADGDAMGSFAFGSIQKGNYTLHILDNSGQVVREEFIQFDGSTPVMRLRWPESPSHDRPNGQRVSLQELKLSKKERNVLIKAQTLVNGRQYDKAANVLEKAIQTNPDFATARTNLSAQYLR